MLSLSGRYAPPAFTFLTALWQKPSPIAPTSPARVASELAHASDARLRLDLVGATLGLRLGGRAWQTYASYTRQTYISIARCWGSGQPRPTKCGSPCGTPPSRPTKISLTSASKRRSTPSSSRATFTMALTEAFVRSSSSERAWTTPQNRPRVLMAGVRKDLGFISDITMPAMGLLPRPRGTPPHPVDFLGDLVDPAYRQDRRTRTYPARATQASRWFRTSKDGELVARKGGKLEEHEYSNHEPRIIEKFQHMIDSGGEIPEKYRTKKFAQRVIPRRWGDSGPSITATSLPDDYVHFSQPRTLTVREWARIQTFPDWYKFAGKRTTGGRRRAGDPSKGDWERDLPKYTQVGNAVPVWLAEEIGKHFQQLLA